MAWYWMLIQDTGADFWFVLFHYFLTKASKDLRCSLTAGKANNKIQIDINGNSAQSLDFKKYVLLWLTVSPGCSFCFVLVGFFMGFLGGGVLQFFVCLFFLQWLEQLIMMAKQQHPGNKGSQFKRPPSFYTWCMWHLSHSSTKVLKIHFLNKKCSYWFTSFSCLVLVSSW